MTLGELLRQYLYKEISAIETIRMLTAMVQLEHAVDILALVNQIARHELGDLDTETFKAVYKIE